MNLLAGIHEHLIFSRRVEVLASHLRALLPERATVLDVGCGDGSLAIGLLERSPGLEIMGMDVRVRPKARMPVVSYDGRHFPQPDDAFDFVMLIDVLHHTDDPAQVLREAARVARRGILIKDHLRESAVDGLTLRLMDWVGNAPHGVAMPYNYWSERQWHACFDDLGLKATGRCERLGLYVPPLSWCFDRGLHFVVRLEGR